jgi:arginine decarboxylase
VIADLTCDSDGKMDQFIELRDVKNSLELHPFDGKPYYLGVFLVGAYQEILGDLHNLFGDTNAVHISLDETGYRIDHVVEGDSVTEVLGYVQYRSSTSCSACARRTRRRCGAACSRSRSRRCSCAATTRGCPATPTSRKRTPPHRMRRTAHRS